MFANKWFDIFINTAFIHLKHLDPILPLINPLVGGGSDSQGQKIKKIVEDKCYTFYFLPLSLTGENIRLWGGHSCRT